MGNYFFVNTAGEQTKAEFSFAVKENDDQQMKIVLHHSSLPFKY
jgi:hypothetical protein